MTASDRIRPLAGDGLTTAEIARRLGIRYQHAYNVYAILLRAEGGEPNHTIEWRLRVVVALEAI